MFSGSTCTSVAFPPCECSCGHYTLKLWRERLKYDCFLDRFIMDWATYFVWWRSLSHSLGKRMVWTHLQCDVPICEASKHSSSHSHRTDHRSVTWENVKIRWETFFLKGSNKFTYHISVDIFHVSFEFDFVGECRITHCTLDVGAAMLIPAWNIWF